MKKISYIFAVALVAVFASCKKTTELPEGGPATYSVKATGETSFASLPKNAPVTVTFCATTTDTGVRDQLTATFKTGGQEYVDLYNASVPEDRKATLLPEEAYTFVKNNVTIDRYNKDSRSGSIAVTNLNTMAGKKWYVLPVTMKAVTGSDKVSVDSTVVACFAFYALDIDKGNGSKDKPFLIYEVDDLLKLREQCKEITDDSSIEKADAATPTYFKMMEDIDLAGVDWTPYNYNDNYLRKIDFNGNHKTISNLTCDKTGVYASVFGVLFGTVYDLNVKNANIKSNQTAGVMCGYLGTGNKKGHIHNCSVQGRVETNNSPTGGLVGQNGVGGDIYECVVDVEVVEAANKNFVGGLIGYDKVNGCAIHDCIVKGSVNGYITEEGGGTQRVGGIMGMLYKENSSVVNCIALNTLKGCRAIGGIVGHANMDKWDERHPNNVVKGCIAWNPEIISTLISEDGASNGAIVGFTSEYNTYIDCVRRPDMKYTYPAPGFEEGPNNPGGMFNTFFDQENSSDTTPLQGVIHDNGKKLYRSPYNGKAAAAGETASQVAKRLGWDETIWDLSGDTPSLKRVYAE